MAWSNTAGYNTGSARFAIVDKDGGGTNDVPIYKQVYGADAADPTRVQRTAGLPVVGQRTSGSPSIGKIGNATASSTTTGNATAIGTGGSALPGTYVVTADPDNTSVVVLGDSSANAAAKAGSTIYLKGIPLQAGQATVVDTDDLRGWYFAVRTANDGVTWAKVGA